MSSSSTRKAAAMAKVGRERAAHFARNSSSTASSSSGAIAARNSSTSRAKKKRSNPERETARSSAAAAAPAAPAEEWCGPFATARRLLAGQAAAAAERNEMLKGDVESDSEGDDNGDVAKPPPIAWEPSGKGSMLDKYVSPDSLRSLCLSLVADNFEVVEGLGYVSAEVRNKLATLLCRKLQLTPEVLGRLAEPGITELVLPDCSRIDADTMRAVLLQCCASITSLCLTSCGRCFTDATSVAIRAARGFPCLRELTLTGTYMLSDAYLLSIVDNSPDLQHLDLSHNNRLSQIGLKALATKFGKQLKGLKLDFCEQLEPQSFSFLSEFIALETISLRGLPSLRDEHVRQLLTACGSTLRHLDLEDCERLGDGTLLAIGEECRGLATLSIGLVKGFSTESLTLLFSNVVHSSCAGLRKLSLKGLPGVNDAVVIGAAALSAGSLCELNLCSCEDVTDATLVQLAKFCHSSLVHLDVSFCRKLSDDGLGYFVDGCKKLESLHLWGNMQLSDRFFRGEQCFCCSILPLEPISVDESSWQHHRFVFVLAPLRLWTGHSKAHLQVFRQ
jgi:DNA repair protein RAD7